ncbi:MAG: ribosome maturation factor RimM [Pseudomonadota bacterium]
MTNNRPQVPIPQTEKRRPFERPSKTGGKTGQPTGQSPDLSTDGTEPSLILLGQITGAHGIQGQVVIRSFTQKAIDIAAYGALLARPKKQSAGAAVAPRKISVKKVRETKKGLVATIADITDRNTAEALIGHQLFIARTALPDPVDGEFYHDDLIGLAVRDAAGTQIGSVRSVENYGAGDLLEIKFNDRPTSELIPFNDQFVPVVEIAQGYVTVALPQDETTADDLPSQPETP